MRGHAQHLANADSPVDFSKLHCAILHWMPVILLPVLAIMELHAQVGGTPVSGFLTGLFLFDRSFVVAAVSVTLPGACIALTFYQHLLYPQAARECDFMTRVMWACEEAQLSRLDGLVGWGDRARESSKV